MSSPEVIIDFYNEFRNERYVYFASTAMLFYDFTLTFDREVNLFWSKKFTGASALFFFIRYLTFAYELLDMASSLFTMSDEILISIPKHSCNGLAKSYAVMEYSRYVPFALFSAMRAHALVKKRVLSASILALSLLPLVNLATLFPLGLTGIFDPIIGCEVNIVRLTPVEFIMFVPVVFTFEVTPLTHTQIVSRSGLIVADFILVVVTWVTLALGPARPALNLARASRRSLTAIMLWSGLVYFMVLFILNVLHLSFTLTSKFGGKEPSNITLFTDPLTSILTWRFLLDLQEANQRDLKLDSDDPLHMSMPREPGEGSLNFARVMGSIGSIVVSQGADDVEHHGSSDDVPGEYELAEVADADVTATLKGEFGTEAQAGGSDRDPGPI